MNSLFVGRPPVYAIIINNQKTERSVFPLSGTASGKSGPLYCCWQWRLYLGSFRCVCVIKEGMLLNT